MSIIEQWKDFWHHVGRGAAIVLSEGDVVPPYERAQRHKTPGQRRRGARTRRMP